MEIRARYTLIGLFTLTVIVAAFGFVYWLNTAGGLGQHSLYRARFENTVSGLLKGSAVLFNGIRVGEVSDLQLNPLNPKQVTAVLAVAPRTPIRSDTKVGIEFQGLMGSPVVSLLGGTAFAEPVAATGSDPPLLAADPNAGQNISETARSVLRNIDSVVTDNSEPLHKLIGNLNTFSDALARNTDRVDGIFSGLERMTGGSSSKARIFDLVAPHDFPKLRKIPQGQLFIPEPEIVGKLFNDEIVVRSAAGERTTAFNAKWPDALSRVLQSRIVQSFENANYLKALGRQPDGLKIDYQLLIDVRSFEVLADPAPTAEIQISAKIIGENGQILGAKIIQTAEPVATLDEAGIAAGLNRAFGKTVTELIVWTSDTI